MNTIHVAPSLPTFKLLGKLKAKLYSKGPHNSESTVCPAVGDNFDTPLFSELGALIREIFGLVIVHDLTFHLMYNSAPYLENCIGDYPRHFR